MKKFFQLIRKALGLKQGGKVTLNAPRDKAQLYGALHEAEQRLGMTHKGGTITVKLEEGTMMSGVRPWLGRPYMDQGVANGYASTAGYVMLYTTKGRWRLETAWHEFAHMILWSRGVGVNEHHNMMRQHGIK